LYDTAAAFRKGSYGATGQPEQIDDVVPVTGTYWLRVYGYLGSFNTSSAYSLSYTASGTMQTLSVSRGGSGSGSVTSSPSGINCGGTCQAGFATNTQVTLTASAAPGSSFTTWGGACSGSSTQCTVTMSQARSVTANFDTVPQALAVNKSGTGTGTVTSSPSGINCGATCQANFDYNTSVTLTAAAAGGSSFAGWSGACSGSSTQCTVTMSQGQNVTASFNVIPTEQTLTVNRAGSGTGTVTSNPSGINCGVTCSTGFASNTVVTLTATATNPSTFTGWSGEGCTGTGTCQLTMSQARSVTATFTAVATQGANFYVVPACRLIDTRDADGPYGAPALTANKTRNFLAPGRCGIPSGVTALAVNITAVGASSNGWMTLFNGPAGAALPAASTINYTTGRTRANNAIVQVAGDGTINIYNSGPFNIHVIVDVNGYFQ